MRYYVDPSSPLKHGPIFVDELKCFGNETHLNDCSFDVLSDCTHDDDLFLECAGIKQI